MNTKGLLTPTARILAVGVLLCVSTRLLAQGSTGCVPKPAGLIGWWRAEGNSSDSIGTNHGTIYGAVGFAQGKVGQAFVFDGASHVRIADAPNLNFGERSPITVELWAYRTGTAGVMHLMGKRVQCGPESFNYQMAFNENNPTEGLSFGGGATTPGHAVKTGLAMPMTNWVYLAGTFDGSVFRFYTNGVLAASETGTLGPTSSASLTIGGSGYEGTCLPFYGLIDEVGIYNRALSDAEILAIYNAGSDGKCVPAPAHLRMAAYPWLEITGTVGVTYRIEASGVLPATTWLTLTNLVLPSSPYLLLDDTAASATTRFYRAVGPP